MPDDEPAPSVPEEEAALGLRERKKLMARRALQRAAFELFDQQGFEATTVDEIAARADVSRASFFRYFAAKEDVLVADDEARRTAFVDRLTTRPDVPLLDALRAAVTERAREADDHTAAYTRIMLGSRTLMGHAYEIRIRWLRALEQALSTRLASHPRRSVLVPMLADLTLSVLETALRLSVLNPDADHADLVAQGFALLVDPEQP